MAARRPTLTLLMCAVLAALLVHRGLDAARLAASERAPVEQSCAAFLERPAAARWVRLTGCTADLANARFARTGSGIRKAWVPLRPDGAPADAPAPIVLETAAEHYTGLVDRESITLDAGHLYRSTRPLAPLASRSLAGLVARDTVDGSVEILAHDLGLVAPGAWVLTHDAAPSPTGALPYFALAAGAVLLGARAARGAGR